MSRKGISMARAHAEKKAEEKVQIMEDQLKEETGEVLDDDARKALKFAVGVVGAKKDAVRDRLAAARLVLDFTKAKPAANSNVTINTAEEFLAALAQKEE